MVEPLKPWWKMIIEFSWSTGPRHLWFLQDFQRPVRAQVVSPRKHQRGPLSSAPLGGDLPTSQPRWPSNLQLASHHFLPGNMMKCIRFGYTSFRQTLWKKEHEVLNHQIWRYRGVAWHSRSKWTLGKEREFFRLQPVLYTISYDGDTFNKLTRKIMQLWTNKSRSPNTNLPINGLVKSSQSFSRVANTLMGSHRKLTNKSWVRKHFWLPNISSFKMERVAVVHHLQTLSWRIWGLGNTSQTRSKAILQHSWRFSKCKSVQW